ncbi:MAG: toprim domain-containing protein, partial [Janthinobacterium lividum]
FRRGTVRNMQSADFRRERRQADGQPATNAGKRQAQRRDEHDAVAVAQIAADVVRRLAPPLKRLAYDDKEARTARRTMKRPAERPKATPTPRKEPTVTRKPISEVEALGEFADALTRAGFRLRGAPVMDGKMRRVAVDGDRGTKKSGTYVGYSDGTPAGYIHNFKTGEEVRWKASASTAPLSDAERAQLAAGMEATRRARDAERRAAEEATARAAERLWSRGQPVVSHPYLTRKDVGAHGIRVDTRGRLLVPMRDAAGKLWNVQTIDDKGTKLFMKGRKQGTFAVLGEMKPGAPVAIAEGYATAATIRETTGLTTVAAFDSGNLGEVARSLRAADAERSIVFAADNDHHAPRREKPLPNVGMEKAVAAAGAVGGVVLLPAFEPTDSGTDWNDISAQIGKPAVRELVASELAQHGISLPQVAMRSATVSQAARDAARQRMQTPAGTDAAARAAAARQAERQKGAVL